MIGAPVGFYIAATGIPALITAAYMYLYMRAGRSLRPQTRPQLYSLFPPVGSLSSADLDGAESVLNIALGKLEPGYYIMAIDATDMSPATAAKIGWPRIGEQPEVKLCKVLVRGNPRDLIALWRVPGAVEIVGGPPPPPPSERENEGREL